MIKIKDFDKVVDLLKPYTQSSGLKNNFKSVAWYNYGLALFSSGKYDDAKEAFKEAVNSNPLPEYELMFNKMDYEKVVEQRMTKVLIKSKL